MAKIRVASQVEGSVSAFHLDDVPLQSLLELIIPAMLVIDYDSTSTMFLFTSPQKLATTPQLLKALFECRDKQTLRVVTIDEAHLYAAHGRSFREQLRLLTRVFFAVLFQVGIWHPLFLAMTATMTLDLLPAFSKLTCVDWLLPEHQLWSAWYNFQQRFIDPDFDSVDHIGRVYPTLFEHRKKNPDASAFIFVNSRSEYETVADAIDKAIIKDHLPFHHLVVHGHQDKHEKCGYISLFNGTLSMPGFLAQILISTAAANTGIDKDTKDTISWLGIKFRSPRRGNNRVTVFDIIAAKEKAKEILQEY